MNRARIIAATVVLALLGALVPIATVFYFTWSRASESEQVRLQTTAERTLQRAHRAYETALATLRELNQSTLAPCSPEHLQLMRSLVIRTHSAEQVGYFENGPAQCSSRSATTRS